MAKRSKSRPTTPAAASLFPTVRLKPDFADAQRNLRSALALKHEAPAAAQ